MSGFDEKESSVTAAGNTFQLGRGTTPVAPWSKSGDDDNDGAFRVTKVSASVTATATAAKSKSNPSSGATTENYGFTGTPEEHAVASKLQSLHRKRSSMGATSSTSAALPTSESNPLILTTNSVENRTTPVKPHSEESKSSDLPHVPSSSALRGTPVTVDSHLPADSSRTSSTPQPSVRSHPIRSMHPMYATPTYHTLTPQQQRDELAKVAKERKAMQEEKSRSTDPTMVTPVKQQQRPLSVAQSSPAPITPFDFDHPEETGFHHPQGITTLYSPTNARTNEEALAALEQIRPTSAAGTELTHPAPVSFVSPPREKGLTNHVWQEEEHQQEQQQQHRNLSLEESKQHEFARSFHTPGALANRALQAAQAQVKGIVVTRRKDSAGHSPVRTMAQSSSSPQLLQQHPHPHHPVHRYQHQQQYYEIPGRTLQSSISAAPRSRSNSPQKHNGESQGAAVAPTLKTPLWRAATDAAYPGLRSEVAAAASSVGPSSSFVTSAPSAVFLDNDYHLVSLSQGVEGRVRESRSIGEGFVLQSGNEELRQTLTKMAKQREKTRALNAVLHPSHEKFDAKADSMIRRQRHIEEAAPLVKKYEKLARKREAQGAEVPGFVSGFSAAPQFAMSASLFDAPAVTVLPAASAYSFHGVNAAAALFDVNAASGLSPSQSQVHSEAYAARKAIEAMEREILPHRVGLPWFPEKVEPLAASAATGATLATSHSTPTLKTYQSSTSTVVSPLQPNRSLQPVVISDGEAVVPVPSPTLLVHAKPALTSHASTHNLDSHMSSTGKVLPRTFVSSAHHHGHKLLPVQVELDENKKSPVAARVHVTPLSSIVSSVPVTTNSMLRSMQHSASDSTLPAGSSLGASPFPKYQNVWAASKVSQFAARKAALSPEEKAKAFKRAYEQLPPEYKIMLPPPPAIPPTVAAAAHAATSSSSSKNNHNNQNVQNGRSTLALNGAAIKSPSKSPSKPQLSPLKSLLSSLSEHEKKGTANVFNKPTDSNPYTSYFLGNQGGHDERAIGTAASSNDHDEYNSPNKLAYYDEGGRFFSWSQPPTRLNTGSPMRMRISSPELGSDKRSNLITPAESVASLSSGNGIPPSSASGSRGTPVPLNTFEFSAAADARPKYLHNKHLLPSLGRGYSHSLTSLDERDVSLVSHTLEGVGASHTTAAVSNAAISSSHKQVHVTLPKTQQDTANAYVFGSKGIQQQHGSLVSTSIAELTHEALAAKDAADAADAADANAAELVDGEEESPEIISDEETATEVDAATKIQSVFRGHALRKKKEQGIPLQQLVPKSSSAGRQRLLPQLGDGMLQTHSMHLAPHEQQYISHSTTEANSEQYFASSAVEHHHHPTTMAESVPTYENDEAPSTEEPQQPVSQFLPEDDTVISATFEQHQHATRIIESQAASQIQAIYRGFSQRKKNSNNNVSSSTYVSPTSTTSSLKKKSKLRSTPSSKRSTLIVMPSSQAGSKRSSRRGSLASSKVVTPARVATPAAEAEETMPPVHVETEEEKANRQIADLLAAHPGVQVDAVTGQVTVLPMPVMRQVSINAGESTAVVVANAANSTMDSMLYEQKQMDAATRIQALQRGRHARKHTVELKRKITQAEKAAAATEAARLKQIEEAEAAEIRARFTANAHTTDEQEHAAVMIQAAIRGRLARQKYALRKEPVSHPHEAETDSNATEQFVPPTHELSYEEKEAAKQQLAAQRAVVITQKHAIRKDVVSKPVNESAAAAPAFVSPPTHEPTYEETQAAIKMQALARGHATRSKQKHALRKGKTEKHTVDADLPSNEVAAQEEVKAATKIQALHRGRKVRKGLKSQKGGNASPAVSTDAPVPFPGGSTSPQQHTAIPTDVPPLTSVPSNAFVIVDNSDLLSPDEAARREAAALKIQAIARGRKVRQSKRRGSLGRKKRRGSKGGSRSHSGSRDGSRRGSKELKNIIAECNAELVTQAHRDKHAIVEHRLERHFEQEKKDKARLERLKAEWDTMDHDAAHDQHHQHHHSQQHDHNHDHHFDHSHSHLAHPHSSSHTHSSEHTTSHEHSHGSSHHAVNHASHPQHDADAAVIAAMLEHNNARHPVDSHESHHSPSSQRARSPTMQKVDGAEVLEIQHPDEPLPLEDEDEEEEAEEEVSQEDAERTLQMFEA